MSELPRVLIAGGYGAFGQLLARELLDAMSVELVIAGRDLDRGSKFCRTLGAAEPLALDLMDLGAVSRAAGGCFAFVCTAGPFQGLNRNLPATVVRAGSHWLDISDFGGWILPLLGDGALHRIAQEAGVVVMPGMSVVPALSGVLTRWGRERIPDADRARVTLFIGHRSTKGGASIAGSMHSGFGDPVSVDLPVGRRVAYRVDSPDETLFRQELGLEGEFRVAFEWNVSNRMVSLTEFMAGILNVAWQKRLAGWLRFMAQPLSRFGSDAGCLQAEVLSEHGSKATCFLMGQAQRLPVLPCVLALTSLVSGELRQRGMISPATWLSPEQWIDRLRGLGINFSGEVRPG